MGLPVRVVRGVDDDDCGADDGTRVEAVDIVSESFCCWGWADIMSNRCCLLVVVELTSWGFGVWSWRSKIFL